MAWVRVIEEAKATGELKAAYDRIQKARGQVGNVVKITGLLPAVMERNIDLYVALMYGPHKLPRAEREMVAVEVSRANRCDYCVAHHGAALGRVLRDEAKAAQFMRDGTLPGMAEKDRAMLAYARKLALTPAEVGPRDVEAVRHAGFDDEEIVAINHIVGYFSLMNRVVQGLGVELEPDRGASPLYKY
jgi:uncharacterized peroxidase-related enzyme